MTLREGDSTNLCPNELMVQYLHTITNRPDFDNQSLYVLINTDKDDNFSTHISNLLDYEEDDDEIDDVTTDIFDKISIVVPLEAKPSPLAQGMDINRSEFFCLQMT